MPVAGVPFLSMTGITKTYPDGAVANAGVDFRVERGEIHAVVGENGAGKTTLMKVLCGLEKPDRGSVLLEGERVGLHGPHAARRLGIGMVHQHFMLIGELSVAENVTLGAEPVRAGLFLDRRAAETRIRALLTDHGFSVDPSARVDTLSVGEMQQVEIVKVLFREARLVVLDEPTSVLTGQEADRLFATLRSLRAGGATVILVTHRLDEVAALADRVTVMRQGRVVAVRDAAGADREELSRLMYGKAVPAPRQLETLEPGEPVLRLEGATLRRRGGGHPLLDKVDLEVRAREVLGVTGTAGNGLAELEDAVAGLRRLTGGLVFLRGEDVTRLPAAALRARGLAYVPADRVHRGSCAAASVEENLIAARPRDFSRAGFLDRGRIRAHAEALLGAFSVDGGPRSLVGTLSGGNVQKVVLARELSGRPALLLAAEPTWGLDWESRGFVHERMRALRASGAGVFLISTDIEEVLGMADRVAVLRRGRVAAVLPNDGSLTPHRIGEFVLGVREGPWAR